MVIKIIILIIIMEMLPNELIILIFDLISKITDKRHFLRTCILYNKLTKISMYNFESKYKLPDFSHELNYIGVEKFTLELCHDSYLNLIPDRYINDNNKNLIRCLSYYNHLPMLELVKEKGCRISKIIIFSRIFYSTIGECDFAGDEWTCAFAAQNGNLSILKFLSNNNCRWNYNTCILATINGHLDILKYLYDKFGKLDKMLYNIALTKGHFEIIKWFEEIDCDGKYVHIYESDMEKVD